MSAGSAACANCGRARAAGRLDPDGWCEACRARVVRRASWTAWAVLVLSAVGLGALLLLVVQPGPRSMILWILFFAAVCFLLFRLTRRVAFELFRARGVPVPDERE